MAQSLGSLFVELRAETGAFVTGMSKASYEAKKAAKDIQESFDRVGDALGESLSKIGPAGQALQSVGSIASEVFEGFSLAGGAAAIAVGAIGGVAAAALLAAGGLGELAISGAELVENLSNISQKTGISIRDLQTFEAAGATVGVGLDDMVIGMRKFDGALAGVGKGAQYATLVLKDLGVTTRDPKEALEQVADAFAHMPDGVNKANDAIALFGKSGLTLIPLLNKGKEGIGELEQAVNDYGGTIDGKAIKANEDYRLATEKLSLAWTGFKENIVGDVLPTLTKLVDSVSDAERTVTGYITAAIKRPGQTFDDTVLGYSFHDIAAQNRMQDNSPTDTQKAATAAAEAQKKVNDDLMQQAQARYELDKAGGEASLKLEQARDAELLAYNNGDFARAQSIHDQIPLLQAAVDLEKERAAAAEKAAEIQERINQAIASPQTARLRSQWRPQGPRPGDSVFTTPAPGVDNPAIGTAGTDALTAILGTENKAASAFGSGKALVDDFYSNWKSQQKGTEASVNADYDKQLQDWKDLLNEQAISQQQFNDISKKLEQERADGLKQIRKELGTSTFGDAFGDMFNQVAASGRDFARSLTTDIGGAIDGLNQQLAKFIVTGKGLNLQKLGQGLEENLTSSILKKGESSLLGAFGLGGGGKKGDSAANPLWTKSVDLLGGGAGGAVGSLAGGGGLASLFGGGGGGGGFASLLTKLPGLFGGFLAAGGDVSPGKLHVVGENGPEWFVPHTAGRVAPSLKMSNAPATTILHFHVHGVTDADSFQRSQAQTFSSLQQQLQIASARSR